MSLANLIRGKSAPDKSATATPATFATEERIRGRTVASVATVAVANSTEHKAAPLTAEDEKAIREWLALIEETDPATIAEVIERCQRDADARDYFTRRAAELTQKGGE